jgi:hypothetical protein
MKTVYLYDEATGAYIGQYDCHESPLEPGEYLEPVYSVDVAPEIVPGFWPVMVNNDWVNVEDHRGLAFETSTGNNVNHDALGPLPGHLTATPKPDHFSIWNGTAWAIDYALVRAEKIKELRAACAAHIVSGVDHNALGTVHHYPSTKDDQAFLNARFAKSQALGVSGEPYKFMCKDSADNWARRDHTAQQINDVALAVEAHVTDALNRLDLLLAQLAKSADDMGAISAVIW